MTPWRRVALLAVLAAGLVGITGGGDAARITGEAPRRPAEAPVSWTGPDAWADPPTVVPAEPASDPVPPVLPGDPAVRALQEDLAARGYDPGPIDGIRGPLTIRAERASQGIVDPPPPTAAARPVVPDPGPGWSPALHAHPFLVCTRTWESDRNDANRNGLHDGGYEAYNPGGPYLGAYQFLQSTWNSTARAVGRDDLVGVDPRYAGDANQDLMAWALYQAAGNRPWGGRC